VFIALAAPYIDRTRVPGAVAAAVIATAGLTLVLEPWRGAAGVWLGGAMGAVSAVAYAGNVFAVARLVPRIGAARTVSYHALAAAALLAPMAGSGWAAVEASDLARMAAGSITIGALSGVAFVTGLAAIGSARAAVLTFCEPLVAVLIGFLVWREPLGPLAGVGAFLILGAGIHVARERG
jgi:drug/metabolite transporter (DMT)-like permease